MFWKAIWKNHCHIWNQRSRIHLTVNFGEKIKILKFGTRNALFKYFRVRILKKELHIWNQHLWICLIAVFCEIWKCLNLGAKKTIWVFLGWNLKTILCYLKSAPRFWLLAKFREKIKIPKFETKNALFGCFWIIILKQFVIFEISALDFAKL